MCVCVCVCVGVGVLKNNSRKGKSNFLNFKGGAMRGDTVKESLQYTRRLC